MSDIELDQYQVEAINKMGRYEMAEMWRYTPAGHPWFDSTKPYFAIFQARFKDLGGFSPEVSKAIDEGH
jgi:hypothetical protein